MKIVALIPARAGSKGVKRKNLQKIAGLPLVNISINLAKTSPYIENVYVSSDSDEILKISRNSGAIPLRRPKDLSDDTSTANDVVHHFLISHPEFQDQELLIVYLQPTSPFTSSKSLSNCIKMCLEKSNPVVSMKVVSEHPDKMLIQDNLGKLANYILGSVPTMNRQHLPELLIPTGGIYVFSAKDFNKNGNIPVINSLPYIVQGVEGIDIDNEFDLFLAQAIGVKNEF